MLSYTLKIYPWDLSLNKEISVNVWESSWFRSIHSVKQVVITYSATTIPDCRIFSKHTFQTTWIYLTLGMFLNYVIQLRLLKLLKLQVLKTFVSGNAFLMKDTLILNPKPENKDLFRCLKSSIMPFNHSQNRTRAFPIHYVSTFARNDQSIKSQNVTTLICF